MTISEADWLRILSDMGVRSKTAAQWAGPFADECQPDKFSAGMADLLDFLPQVLHETWMLERMEENLAYNAERLVQVWPSRFPSVAAAAPYAFAPQRLANFVYANRMGNGPPESGDGYAFRGRGLVQLTGRAAYARVGDLVGQDLTVVPDLAIQPHYAIQIGIAWWEGTIPDSMLSDQVAMRRKVNGGTLGLSEVVALREKLVEVMT